MSHGPGYGTSPGRSHARTLDGRYALHELLGRGGMAEVRRGEDLRLGRTVAVKTLRLDLTDDATFQARFRREAQSSASLNHPNVVAVYDTGEDVLDGQRVPYIVMEYVEGRTLRDLLHDPDVRITHERALEITAGVLDALEYSHRAGIVHRDIKPANVMVTSRGDVKVMDFGIARTLHDSGATMTQTAAVVGTAQYLSPEQARGEQADARSDLYSTGCLLYELLTGRPPFVGDSLVSVAVSHVRDQPLPPSTYDPTIPREIDAVVMHALGKDRDARYQSADEMRADIERVLAGRPATAADTASTRIIPAAAPVGATSVSLDEAERAQGSRRWILVLVLAVLALGVATAVALLLTRPSGTDQVKVANVVGQTRTAAAATLRDQGLKATYDGRNDASAPRYQVTKQDPAAGSSVDRGSTVNLTYSLGPQIVGVPAIEGLSLDEAQTALTDVGLKMRVGKEQPSTEDRGTVLSSDPGVGQDAAKGSTVSVTVANGQVSVPKVVGLDRAAAEAKISDARLNAQVQTRTGTGTPDSVVEQSPAGGSVVDQDTTVVIYVVQPQPTSPPPTTPTGSGSPSGSPTGSGSASP